MERIVIQAQKQCSESSSGGGCQCLRSIFAFAGREFSAGDTALEPVRSTNSWSDTGWAEQDLDFGEAEGQQHVKRAVEVAAAGAHNILMM
jgi:predicted ATPase with chaperone activity